MTQTRRLVYSKLVRDHIPEIISAKGEIPQVRVLAEDDYVPALFAKLHEEAEELKVAGRDDVLSELADLREVLAALTTALGFTEEQVETAAASKRSARGGFSGRLWLEEVQIP